MGGWVVSREAFTASQAKTAWNMVHGSALLFGTISVALGFVFGVAYLIHARRLKQKLPQSRLFRLPPLEWLQKASERALMISVGLLAIGLVSGVLVNFIQTQKYKGANPLIAWSDPIVWTSSILFVWLFASAVFSMVYRPARQGRKVAYLVIASFLFLLLELVLVWWLGHGLAMDTTASEPIVLLGKQIAEGWQP